MRHGCGKDVWRRLLLVDSTVKPLGGGSAFGSRSLKKAVPGNLKKLREVHVYAGIRVAIYIIVEDGIDVTGLESHFAHIMPSIPRHAS